MVHKNSDGVFGHELQNIFLCFEIFFSILFGAGHYSVPFKISKIGKGITGSDLGRESVMV